MKLGKPVTTTIFLIGLSANAFAAGDAAAGKDKAVTCGSCHTKGGVGVILDGRSADYIEKQLTAYKLGDVKHPMMNMIAQKLSVKDIKDLAAHFAALGK